jgi:hypothetical protein
MSLLTYEQARPWAKSIREAVIQRNMPPWFADAAYGKFHNERRLSDGEIQTLKSWADGGAPAGKASEGPKPVQFLEGWNIGRPDAVFEMADAYEVPAAGTVEYQYFVIPTKFAEDRWVQVMEVRPGNRSVVHHAAVFIRTPDSKWMRNAKAGEIVSGRAGEDGQGLFDELLDFHVPGAIPHALPDGQAKLIPAGSDLVFQMHYTATGKVGSDRTRVGFLFSKEPPKERVFTMIAANRGLMIPAGAADHPVSTTITVQENTRLVAMYPHMHLRGKSMQFKATYPTGESEILLKVPDYKFFWQLQYYLAEEKSLPAGTRIEVSGRFDNSANNKYNPDATKDVRWGDQSWEEMLVGTMEMAIPAKMNPMELYRPKRRPAAE